MRHSKDVQSDHLSKVLSGHSVPLPSRLRILCKQLFSDLGPYLVAQAYLGTQLQNQFNAKSTYNGKPIRTAYSKQVLKASMQFVSYSHIIW